MKRFLWSVVLVHLIMLAAPGCRGTCDGWFGRSAVRGSGDLSSEVREIDDVHGVNLATIGTLHIQIGDTEKLEIEADDNLLEYIETEVRRGVLKIESARDVNLKPQRAIHYYLTVKALDRISISSVGDIEAPDLSAKKFSISISSTGDLEMGDLDAKVVDVSISSTGSVEIGDLHAELLDVSISSTGNLYISGGKVAEQEISISSTGDYQAKKLESDDAEVRLSSTGSATIQVHNYLNARLSSTGSVYYLGNPDVDRHTSSVGRVKQIGKGQHRRGI